MRHPKDRSATDHADRGNQTYASPEGIRDCERRNQADWSLLERCQDEGECAITQIGSRNREIEERR